MTELHCREFALNKLPSADSIHAWVRERLQLERGSYELVELCMETHSGRLTDASCLPLQNITLSPHCREQLVLLLRVRCRRSGSMVRPPRHVLFYLLPCQRATLLTALSTHQPISISLLQDAPPPEDDSSPPPPQREEERDTPYRYSTEDELPLEAEYATITTLVHSRLQLAVSMSQATSEEARTRIAQQAEQLFADPYQDKLSLHLCCGLLAALADPSLHKASEFAACEALLFTERCRLRQCSPTQREEHQHAIFEDISQSALFFLAQPLPPHSTHWMAVTQATACWLKTESPSYERCEGGA